MTVKLIRHFYAMLELRVKAHLSIQDGFKLVSVRGSHHKFRHPISNKMTIITHPKRDMPIGTVRAIYRQVGWDKD